MEREDMRRAGETVPPPKALKRYTTVSRLQEILEDGKLIFSDPSYWDDENDKSILKYFQMVANVPKLFILCFSSGHETIHFWKTYACGKKGCCINFEPEYILGLFEEFRLRHGYVQYEEIKNLRDAGITSSNLPFFKRYPYRIEEEYRVLFESDLAENQVHLRVDPTKCLKKVVLGPGVPDSEIAAVKKQWRKLASKDGNTPHRTTVLKSGKWFSTIRRLIDET